MRPISVTVTGAGVSSPIPMDYTLPGFSVGIGCVKTGTVNYTVEHTFDNIWSTSFDPSTATWFPNTGLSAKTANADGNYAFPVRAIRLNVASSDGTVTMHVIQSTDTLE